MAVVGTVFTKDTKYFTPLLKIGGAVKDPKFAFVQTMVWEKIIDRAVRRIYSGKCGHFLDALHFLEKKRKKNFGANHFFWETQLLVKKVKNHPGFFTFLKNPHPLLPE